MSGEHWKTLVEHYKGERVICNCQHAYYTPCGTGSRWDKTLQKRVDVTDALVCAGGCSSNQIAAKEDIAKRIVCELNIPLVVEPMFHNSNGTLHKDIFRCKRAT